MSWHYLAELVGESSGACCTGGEPLPPLRSKTTHAEFYCKGKLTESYLDSLSGMMSVPSTESPGEGRLTSSPEDSPARTSVPQEGAPVSEVPGPDSGPRWQGSLARFDLDTHSWKTHRCLWEEDLPLSSVTLPRWGMMRGGECWELLMSERPTAERGSGLWPTPTKLAAWGKLNGARWSGAAAYVNGIKRNTDLDQYVKHLGRHDLSKSMTFREWLMGWPIGWSGLRPLEMGKFQRWLRLHGRCLVGVSND